MIYVHWSIEVLTISLAQKSTMPTKTNALKQLVSCLSAFVFVGVAPHVIPAQLLLSNRSSTVALDNIRQLLLGKRQPQLYQLDARSALYDQPPDL